ncbi:hypothetical protein [Streptomyces sp. NPDC052721]|uniref:effector-associated constant component EACC1 n=1 Tax=Streptomyces sp. NPDC052721 TaxID=3154955 RepID=UPI00341A3D06
MVRKAPGSPVRSRGAEHASVPVVARGTMDFDVVTLGVIAGLSGILSTLSRLAVVWLRSRHPRRARMTVGGVQVDLDLSNPKEAAEYLRHLQERTPGG